VLDLNRYVPAPITFIVAISTPAKKLESETAGKAAAIFSSC
jgi:hypothetical protein